MPRLLNPLSWVPFHGDKRSRRAALLGAALVFSLTFHAGLPMVKWHNVEAIANETIVVEFMPPPPMPLPEAEELVAVPNEEEVKAPVNEEKPVAKKAEPEPEPDEPDEPEETEEPEPPAPSEIAPKFQPSPEELARIAEFDRKREERRLAREKRRAEREARRAAREAEANGGRKGGAPPASDYKTGKPDAVYLCNATDKGHELQVTKQRGIHDWITIVPTVLAGFATRPSLGRYVDDVTQIISRSRDVGPKRLGFVELALPNEVLQIELEEPRGVRIAVGRLDAKCLVGFKYASKLFPFSVARAPVRILDNQNNSVSALVDVTFFKDASLELTSSDGSVLPFKKARLKNGNDIQRNIQDHYEAARLAKGIAEAFGIQIGPKRPPPRATTPAGSASKRTIAAEKNKKRAQE